MTWLSTTTGRIVDLLRPDPAAIDFRGDVAPQLARVARFGGAVGSGARTIWIAGGAKTYARFLPHVRRAIVTLIDYDGPADVWMPQLWETCSALPC